MGVNISFAPSNSTSTFESVDQQKHWKPLVNAIFAKQEYVAEGSLCATSTENELEFRVLLDDKLAYDLFVHRSHNEQKEVFNCWELLLELKKVEFDVNKLIKIANKSNIYKINLVELYELSKSNTKTNNETLKKYYHNMLMITFADLMNNFFIPFTTTEEYAHLCRVLRKLNTVVSNDFEYFSCLGSGGFGSIFSCRKRSTQQLYAMKVQPKAGLLRQNRERQDEVMVELLVSISHKHPYICEAAYAFQTSKLVYIAFPIYACGDLRRILNMEPNNRLSLERATFYAAVIASALCYLHNAGLIYRDLKPENILMQSDGHIVLSDLGSITDNLGVLKDTAPTSNAVEGSHMDTVSHNTVSMTNVLATGPQSVNFSNNHNSSSNINLNSTNSVVQLTSTNGVRSPLFAHSSVLSGVVSSNISAGNSINFSQNSMNEANSQSISGSYLSRTRAIGVVGTMAYMAPEIVGLFADKQGLEKLDGYTVAVDWFSFGILIHEFIVGKTPFKIPSGLNYRRLHQVYPSILRLANFDLKKAYNKVFGRLQFSTETSALIGVDGVNLLTGLLDLNPITRKGVNSNMLASNVDANSELKSHPFFKNIDWDLLNKKGIPPPYVPSNANLITLQTDTSYTDEEILMKYDKRAWSDFYEPDPSNPEAVKRAAAYDLQDEQQEFFKNWNYVHPEIIKMEQKCN